VKEQHMASKKSDSSVHSADTVEITHSVGPQQFQFCPLNIEQQTVMCAALNNTGNGNQYEVHSQIEYHGVGTSLSEQFSTHRIIGDGNCYFRCLSYALTGSENAHHHDLRRRVVQFERQNRTSVEVHVWTGDTFEGHVSRMSMVGSYARETDILASAAMLNVNIDVYQQQGNSWAWCKYSPDQLLASNDCVQPVDGIYLVNTNSNHFDIVSGVHANTSSRSVYDTQPELTQNTWQKSQWETVTRKKAKKTSVRQSEHLEKDRLRKFVARANETPEQRTERLGKNRLRMATSRVNETVEKQSERLGKDRLRTATSRSKETSEQRRTRLETDRQNKRKHSEEESVEELKTRLLHSRTFRAKKRQLESSSETQFRKMKRKLYEKSKKDSTTTDDTLNAVQNDIQQKTHFLYLCISDMRYHCLGNVVKVKFNRKENDKDCLRSQQSVKNERLRNMTHLTNDTKSFDGQWYICHGCKRSIERGHVPSCNEKHHNFQVPDMPHEFKTQEMALNKLESHLLKLIIPFIRVVHIPRSSEFKILGPMICVEADIKQTMDKLLPVEQHLIPVCLKRRPEYKGHFIEEVVSMTKIMKYFEYFKTYNPLFKTLNSVRKS